MLRCFQRSLCRPLGPQISSVSETRKRSGIRVWGFGFHPERLRPTWDGGGPQSGGRDPREAPGFDEEEHGGTRRRSLRDSRRVGREPRPPGRTGHHKARGGTTGHRGPGQREGGEDGSRASQCPLHAASSRTVIRTCTAVAGPGRRGRPRADWATPE